MTEVINIFKKSKVTYENFDDIISTDNIRINFTCSKCGYHEDVPDWIVSELNPFSRKPSIECPKCNKAMYRTKNIK